MNKLYFSLLLMMMYTSAFAGQETHMCKLMSDLGYRSDSVSCYQTINNRVFDDRNALRICNYASNNGYRPFTIRCLGYIGDKMFASEGQMQGCLVMASKGYKDDSLTCLRSTPQLTASLKLNQSEKALILLIKEDIERAIEELSNGHYSEAELILYKALKKL